MYALPCKGLVKVYSISYKAFWPYCGDKVKSIRISIFQVLTFRNFAAPFKMHSIQFETPVYEPIDICLVKSVSALLSYVIPTHSTPIFNEMCQNHITYLPLGLHLILEVCCFLP